MATHHVPVEREPQLGEVAPTTRLGRWAVGLAVVSLVALGMFGVVARVDPTDPPLLSFWGVIGLSMIVAPVSALAAAIVGLIAVIRGERARSIYLAYLPLVITVAIPFIWPSI